MTAGERLELGRRLARNKKLGELARMVGRFKQDARAIRKRTLERGVAEAYDIERGADLGRMIPSELVAMHHPILRHDFHRRLLEGRSSNTACATTSRSIRDRWSYAST